MSPSLPTEAQHYHTYCELGERVAPEPVVIRTLDLGGEKYFHEVLGQQEARPVLGLRGVRLWLQRPDVARPQLRGLLRAAARFDLRMLLPLVTSPEEVRLCALRLGYRDETDAGAGDALLRDHRKHTAAVSRIFTSVFRGDRLGDVERALRRRRRF